MRSLTIGRFTAILLGVGALLWTPAQLAAQACLGSPTLSRQTAAELSLSFADGATGYGAGVTTKLAGPLALGANVETVSFDNIDKNANRFGVRMAYELPVAALSLCPAVGARYTTFGTTLEDIRMDMSQVLIPLGFGVGKRFDLEQGLVFIPSAMGNVLYYREKASLEFEGDGGSITGTATKFGGTVGATLGFNRFFGRGAVSFDNIEDSKSVVSLSLGVVF